MNNWYRKERRVGSKIYIILLSVWLAGMLVSPVYSAEADGFDYKFLQSFINYIQKKYVKEVSDRELMDYTLSGILSSLDPHSAYLDKKSYDEVKVATKGEFGGIGVEVIMEKGLLKVISPYEGTPAFKAGMKPQDLILMIDGQSIKGMTLEEAGEKMRGRPGSKVNIKIYRESTGSLDLNVVREIIKIPVIKSRVVGEGSVAYLGVRVFNDRSASMLRKEYEKIMKENPEIIGLVLDLRWNPGGIFDQAREVADLFLSDGDIVSIKGRDERFNKVFKADPEDITRGQPIVVLINKGSASAAEIVAGALQDNKRALVVGAQSFGKGSVQEIIPLSDGAAIKLTTALYYTPSGISIQAQGIAPDITVPEAIVTTVNRDDSISEALLKGHLKNKEEQNNINSGNSIRYASMNIDEEKDFQLLRAVDIVKTLTFYSNYVHFQKKSH